MSKNRFFWTLLFDWTNNLDLLFRRYVKSFVFVIQSVFNNLIAIETALLRLLEELIWQNQVHRMEDFWYFNRYLEEKKILKKKIWRRILGRKIWIFFIRNSENIKNLDFKYLFFVTLAVPKASKKQFQ